MDELQKLERLSLVAKVCTELENHLGMNDKVLAEFIISLAAKNDTPEKFKKALMQNGAELPESFIGNLLKLIQRMQPSKSKGKKPASAAAPTSELSAEAQSALERKKTLLPGLAIPNK
eukprot:Opistho-2@14842